MNHNKNDMHTRKVLVSVISIILIMLLGLITQKLNGTDTAGGSEQGTGDSIVIVDTTEERTTQAIKTESEKTEEKKTEEKKTEEKKTEEKTTEEKTTAAEVVTEEQTTTEAPTEVTTAAVAEVRFRNRKLLQQHYEKHGIEMGFASEEDYEAAAAAVTIDPNALHKTEKEDGDDIYYIEKTNEFVVVSTDGYIRTYFNPSGGLSYYERQ